MMIVPTLRVGMPPRTLRVRSGMWRRCVPKLQRYPRHALGLLNPQSASHRKQTPPLAEKDPSIFSLASYL